MSVIVSGMEMPEHCGYCRFRYDGICHALQKTQYSMEEFPLVPVPPHGRLIDADAYEKLLRGLGNRDYRREAGTLQDAIKLLHPHYAPTIIPASEGGET